MDLTCGRLLRDKAALGVAERGALFMPPVQAAINSKGLVTDSQLDHHGSTRLVSSPIYRTEKRRNNGGRAQAIDARGELVPLRPTEKQEEETA